MPCCCNALNEAKKSHVISDNHNFCMVVIILYKQ